MSNSVVISLGDHTVDSVKSTAEVYEKKPCLALFLLQVGQNSMKICDDSMLCRLISSVDELVRIKHGTNEQHDVAPNELLEAL